MCRRVHSPTHSPSSPAEPPSRLVKPQPRHEQQVQLIGCLQHCRSAKTASAQHMLTGAAHTQAAANRHPAHAAPTAQCTACCAPEELAGELNSNQCLALNSTQFSPTQQFSLTQ